MKGKRFQVEKIISILKEAESGTATTELCRRHGIASSTLYNWKAKYGDMNISDARRLKELEHENGRLKKLVANLSLDIEMLKEVNSKNW